MKTKVILFVTIVILIVATFTIYKPTKYNTDGIRESTSTEITKSSTSQTYTLSDISSHNSRNSCFVAVQGKVYDVTAFISKHPGGVENIMKGCGRDATETFSKVPPHEVARLNPFFIGNLN